MTFHILSDESRFLIILRTWAVSPVLIPDTYTYNITNIYLERKINYINLKWNNNNNLCYFL